MNRFITHLPIIPAWRSLVFMLFLSGHSFGLYAQCILVCNQGLQISLDPDGQALINASLIAPNAVNSCPGPLQVTLFNHLGEQIPNPLTCDNIGQVVTAEVQHIASGNSCTSDLEVFDALPPVLTCTDKFIFCNENPEPAEIGIPTATDNCTPTNDLDYYYVDAETSLGCGVFQNGVPVLKRIDRSWTVTDANANSATCSQTIWLKHIQASDITYPQNRDNIGAPALVCGDDPEDLALTGEPTVAGIPVGYSIDCEISTSYTDQIVNLCLPAAYTVIRTWTTIDYCISAVNSRIQIIRVEDKLAPVIDPLDNLTIGTDGFTCAGSLDLPTATATDNCSAVDIVPSWTFGTGYGFYSSIPLGTHIVTYTATDACGNSATATMQVTVEDTSPPQAICSSNLQLSLSSNGGAYLNAGIIGGNSSDNCGPVVLDVSRDNVLYAPQLLLTCADIGQPVTIQLRVTDTVGLENYCETEVSVRDFLKPSIQCPPGLTLSCLQDYTDLSITGEATATDNCTLESLDFLDDIVLDGCNIGAVSRLWKAIDSEANIKTCTQIITLQAVDSTLVAFPADILLNDCSGAAAIHPDSTGWPILSGASCFQPSINYTDQIFSGAPPFCSRIQRDWKVIDHCIYDPNGGSTGVWEHTQIIDIIDNTAPVLKLPANISQAADLANCSANVLLNDVLVSDCSAQVTVSNNSAYANASGKNATGQYPIGQHIVRFVATDACGNSSSKDLEITVIDETPPTAICLPGLTVQIASNGFAVPDPQDFDGGSFDICSPQNSLEYQLIPDTFDCQNIGLQAITLTVQDTAGNSATCATFVQVLDNDQVCIGGGQGYSIEGTIRTPTGLGVRDIPLRLLSNGLEEVLDCDSLGIYTFLDVPAGDTCLIRPKNNANWLNGITTYDLVLISKHILGIAPLPSPLKMIAADANHSNSITTFDIVQLRKLLLGILDTLPGNDSWRFIDSSYVFPDMLNPFSSVFPEELLISNLDANQMGKNFTALKIGDVNDSTDPANARSPQDTLFMKLPPLHWLPGERFSVSLELPDWNKLEGFQFELEFDPDLVIVESIDFANPTILNEKHVALKAGKWLSVSWDHAQPAEAHNPGLFTLNLFGVAASEIRAAVKIRRKRLVPEAYFADNELVAAIELWRNEGSDLMSTEPIHLYPNPNSGVFQVENPLGTQAERLRILDALGRVIWQASGVFSETISVSLDNLLPGIYMVELTGNGQGRAATFIHL